MKWSVVSPLRVALLDDHALIRDALEIRLALEPDFKIQGVYSTSRELLDALRGAQVDLVVLDYQLTEDEIDGLRLIRSVRTRFPDTRILIFSSSERPATINMCLRAGATGFVGKSQATDELLRAIRIVALDRLYLAPTMIAKLDNLALPHAMHQDEELEDDLTLMGHPSLSPKECEVLRCCLEGMSVSQIATKFIRSRKTISGQKQAAFRKLGISTDTELFKLQVQLMNTEHGRKGTVLVRQESDEVSDQTVTHCQIE